MWSPSDPPYRQATATTARSWRGRFARYALVGTRCTQCQQYHFPPQRCCPECRSDVEPSHFSGTGEIVCAAEDHSPLMGHAGRSRRPFAMIRLREGPVILAEIVEADFDEIPEGTAVEMVVRQWRREHSGRPQYGFKFRPLK